MNKKQHKILNQPRWRERYNQRANFYQLYFEEFSDVGTAHYATEDLLVRLLANSLPNSNDDKIKTICSRSLNQHFDISSLLK